MTPMEQFPVAVVAAISFPHIGHLTEVHDVIAAFQPEVAVPFEHTRNVVLYSNDLQNVSLRDQLFESSIAGANPISVIIQMEGQSPAELVQEFKRISGLTWAQVANILEVSERAPFDWASGRPVNAKNHERLGLAIAAIRFIDRGVAEENRNLLLSEAVSGRTYLDLLRAEEFEHVRKLAGEGTGRPSFGRNLTAAAAVLNAPRHFGESIEAGGGGDGSEILPVSKPKLRRARGRRSQA